MIRAVLFDLDDTLCDAKPAFEAGLRAAFATIREHHLEFTDETLRRTWREVHGPLFADLADGRLSMAGVRRERFHRVLSELGIPNNVFAEELDLRLGRVQLDRLVLSEGHEILEDLRDRELHVGIVTNGAGDAHPDSQRSKARHLGLLDRVDSFWVSDEISHRKPDARAFLPALAAAGCAPSEAIYVGDSPENDVLGANRAGMTSVLLWRSESEPPESEGQAQPNRVVRSLRAVSDLIG